MADEESGTSTNVEVEDALELSSSVSGSSIGEDGEQVILMANELAAFRVPNINVKNLDIDLMPVQASTSEGSSAQEGEESSQDDKLRDVARVIAGCPSLEELIINIGGVTNADAWKTVIDGLPQSTTSVILHGSPATFRCDGLTEVIGHLAEKAPQLTKVYLFIPIADEHLAQLARMEQLERLVIKRVEPTTSEALHGIIHGFFEKEHFVAFEIIPQGEIKSFDADWYKIMVDFADANDLKYGGNFEDGEFIISRLDIEDSDEASDASSSVSKGSDASSASGSTAGSDVEEEDEEGQEDDDTSDGISEGSDESDDEDDDGSPRPAPSRKRARTQSKGSTSRFRSKSAGSRREGTKKRRRS